jgi:hypothetical protein
MGERNLSWPIVRYPLSVRLTVILLERSALGVTGKISFCLLHVKLNTILSVFSQPESHKKILVSYITDRIRSS